MNEIKTELTVGSSKLTLEVGRFAKFANASVLGRYGDTMVLATVVASKEKSKLSYFPLSVEYAERLYAGGKIKGSRWVKREGRPSDDAILSGRLIDRSIRPLFPKDYKHDVQVVITLLSVDGENDPVILSLIAVSTALAISNIPWNGPIGAIRIGKIEGDQPSPFIANPPESEMSFSKMDLIVSATDKKVVMIEGGLSQVSEKDTFEAISFAKGEIKKIISSIQDLVKKTGKAKQKYVAEAPDEKLIQQIRAQHSKKIDELVIKRVEKESDDALELLVEDILEKNTTEYDKDTIKKAIDVIFRERLRHNIIEKGIRPDSRKFDEVRRVSSEVSILPRTHGSAIFERGETQALSIATLASPSLEQLIESAEGEETKRYIHHYNMPPYSVGETGRVGYPSRREIGHGALAERALLPVIPSEEKFPYTIRIVSEVMSSNGSTSMASTCGSTMALMDAGVPILAPVAGISIGLVEEGTKHQLLTDIIGIEDFCGDMDFKVAGTKTGITAIQLDVKNHGLTDEIIAGALEKARTARLAILSLMEKVLSAPRSQISQFAPKVVVVKVKADKVGAVIGPGGKIIRQIISETGVTVDVDDEDESVTISGTDEAMVKKAKDWVEGIVRDIEVGELFEGPVKRILNFGAFVELFPGKEGLVHVSRMGKGFVEKASDVVKIGEIVKVKVIEIDEQGRINLAFLDASNEPLRRPDKPRFRKRI